MGQRFEVQARVLQRDGQRIVRDEVRLATSDSLADVTATAVALVAEGFTTWIFAVHRNDGRTPIYRLIDTRRPETSPADPCQATGAAGRGRATRLVGPTRTTPAAAPPRPSVCPAQVVAAR